MTRARLAAVVATAALLFVVGWLALVRPNASQSISMFSDGTISERRELMRSYIKEEGGHAAYAAFSEAYASYAYDEAHTVAHLFGESLYDVEGVTGIAACDSNFNYGCYHGFFAVAVAEEGLDVVAALDAACEHADSSRSSACRHGIGHGILEYLGNDRLVEALEACSLTDQPDPLAGCTGGVFMEYNVPFTADADGSFVLATRPLDEVAGPYAPCGTIPQRFRGSCVLELPQWWNQVLNQDFAKMGALCAGLPEEARSICVSGIGKIAPSSAAYSVEGTEALCALMPHGWYDTCITQAAWAFAVNTVAHDKAVAVCAHASVEAQTTLCPK